MFIWNLLLILVLIGLNGFFVSVEFAAVSSRKARVELLAAESNAASKIVKSWIDNSAARDRLIAASQLGITIVSLTLGAVGENTFEQALTPYFEGLKLAASWQWLAPVLAVLPLALSLIIVTSLHVVLGEQVPKVATLHDPERVALVSARPMNVFSVIFKWFIDLLDWITQQILRLVGLKYSGGHSLLYSVEEIKQILSDSEETGVIEGPERQMLESIFDFGELLVRQVMIPRTEIIGVEANASREEIIQVVTQTTFTKLPVYEDDLDQILGILHVKDLLRAFSQSDGKDFNARSLLREPLYVPETLPVNELLHKFRQYRQHIAIVMDEYGGTAGLVTLEDLLEEIVGEVSDPFDKITPEIQSLPDGTLLIDGLALIEDVNEHLGLDLQDPHYDTIAGYVLGRLGRIPQVGDMVESDGVNIGVEAMDGLRISRLSVKKAGLE